MKIENIEFTNEPTLVIVRGIPGSGKTTFAKYCVEKLKTENIKAIQYEADDYFMHNGQYKFDITKLAAAHKWCFEKTFSSFDRYNVVFVTNTFTTMKELNPYLKEANLLGIKVIVVRMANEYQNQHNVPEATLTAMRQRFCDYPNEITVKNNNIEEEG